MLSRAIDEEIAANAAGPPCLHTGGPISFSRSQEITAMIVIQSRKHGNNTHLNPETLPLVREELYQGGVQAGFRWLPRETSNQWPYLVEFDGSINLVHANGVVSKFTLDEFEHLCKLLVFWLQTSAELGESHIFRVISTSHYQTLSACGNRQSH